MEIDNLEAFIRVAETKSFSKSAEELNITQPAISKRIAALETKFRTKLFDRRGRNVRLTEAGRILLPSARYIQSEVSRIRELCCCRDQSFHGTLSLGTTPYTTTKHLAPVLRDFHHKLANVSIDLRIQDTTRVIDNLLNNSIELGVCSMLDSPLAELPDSLLSIEWLTEKLHIVASEHSPWLKHPGADNGVISNTQLSAVSAILPPPATLERRIIDRELLHHGFRPSATPVDAPDFSTMRSLAVSGLGWTLLPESEIDNTLVRLEVKGLAFTQSVAVLHRSNRTLSRSANSFLELLPQQVEKQASTTCDTTRSSSGQSSEQRQKVTVVG